MEDSITKQLKEELIRLSALGCSDGNCFFVDNSKGQHTNGGCRCQVVPTNFGRSSGREQIQYLIRIIRLTSDLYKEMDLQ